MTPLQMQFFAKELQKEAFIIPGAAVKGMLKTPGLKRLGATIQKGNLSTGSKIPTTARPFTGPVAKKMVQAGQRVGLATTNPKLRGVAKAVGSELDPSGPSLPEAAFGLARMAVGF